MISSSFQDSDGFKLKFEENCSDSDKKFFMEQYPKVDEVANMRLHCTTCNVHIGTAPVSEKMLSTHLVLKVTQCCNCYTFYVSEIMDQSFYLIMTLKRFYFLRISVTLEEMKMGTNNTANGVVV